MRRGLCIRFKVVLLTLLFYESPVWVTVTAKTVWPSCQPLQLITKSEQNLEIHPQWRNPLRSQVSCSKYYEWNFSGNPNLVFNWVNTTFKFKCTPHGWKIDEQIENGNASNKNRAMEFEKLSCRIKCGVPENHQSGMTSLHRPLLLSSPWTVGIYRNNSYCCAGTLINPGPGNKILILTAARLIGSNQHPHSYKISIGDKLKQWISESYYASQTKRIFKVAAIKLHPNYSNSPAGLNDLALLTTVDPISPSDESLPACLPSAKLNFSGALDLNGHISVFKINGTIGGDSSAVLEFKTVRKTILPKAECDVMAISKKRNLPALHFCAGNGTAPCKFQKPGGVGIVFPSVAGNEAHYIIEGVENGKIGSYRSCVHAYTPVYPYVNWIISESDVLVNQKVFPDQPNGRGKTIISNAEEENRTATSTTTEKFYTNPERSPHVTRGGVATYVVPISVVIVVLILTVGTTSLCWRIYLHRQTKISKEEVEEFLLGCRNPDRRRNSTGSAGEACGFVHAMPYDTAYEIDEADLEIDQSCVLGHGNYGIVFRGKYRNDPVAVKTVKAGAEREYLTVLLSELKVMIYLKHHMNLVSVIGAHTKFLQRGTLYIVVDLCPRGSLTKHLRKHRDTFESECFEGIQNTEPGAPIEEDCGSDAPLSTRQLLRWSYQISSAMEYLENKKVIHADLATRNVLLTENLIAKVSDFGLSRQLYEHMEYVKKHKEPMPWRWMAPESLQMLHFSSQSDVWSFGITLWEIFTLGDVPYPGLSYSVDFPIRLAEGLRLYKPPYAPARTYEIMQECWNRFPQNRPSFSTIKSILLEVLNTHSHLEEYTHLEFR